MKRNTIAMVEDDPLIRESIVEQLSFHPAWDLISIFTSATEALDALIAAPPAVLLMDIQLLGMSGIECVSLLKQHRPEIQVMMVTVYDNNDRIYEALAAGANGYLLKRDVPDKLLDSLDDLICGGSPMSSGIAREVFQYFRKSPEPKNQTHNLSPREVEILDLVVQGAISKEIGTELGIGVQTVSTRLRNIYAKLQVRTRTEAVVKHLGIDSSSA